MASNGELQDPGRVRPLVGLAALLGRGFQRLATDAALVKARSFPRRVGDLDAKALSKIMGKTVTSVELLDGSAGTSSQVTLGPHR